jgi:excisionase family DNA binding protein
MPQLKAAQDSSGDTQSPRAAETHDRRRTDPTVLTVDEAAALLRVDRKSVYDSIRRGELPGVVRVGRVIRISRSALLQ